jgi:hypothetical protein
MNQEVIMIINAPHSVARAFLAMKELESFLPRYCDIAMRVIEEYQNVVPRLAETKDKDARGEIIGGFLARVNEYVLGKDSDSVVLWPLFNHTPIQVGLAFRSQLIYTLTRDEVTIHHILNFINIVYFPSLNLLELNNALLTSGRYARPNKARYQKMLVLLAHQVVMNASHGELALSESEGAV